MRKFKHVEDYLELLAGYEPLTQQSSSVIFNTGNTTFSLARYDVQIVESMASHTLWSNRALTDKQGELAVRLVLKYRKQFANQGIDISPVEQPVFRNPLRTVDRTKRISLENDMIVIRFPYDKALIDEIHKFKTASQGSVRWHQDTKQWHMALTEYNLNWVVAWGQAFQFEIQDSLLELFGQVMTCEAVPYEIKLVVSDDKCAITNAAPSLVEYIDQRLGGFNLTNLNKLIDYAGILGYTISQDIPRPILLDAVDKHYNYVKPSQANLDMVLQYAQLADRWPVCIYNPGVVDYQFPDIADKDIVRFDRNGKTSTSDYDPYCVKVVYAQKIPKTWDFPVPLLVTTVEMMYGGMRNDWLSKAEKVVYFVESKLKDSVNGDSQINY